MKPQVWMDYRNDQLYKAEFHSHLHFEIYYFHEGKCNYLIGDKIYVLAPGDLIIMHGMTLHRPHILGDTYVRSVIHFDPGFTESLFHFAQRMQVLRPFYNLRNQRIHLQGSERQSFETKLARLAAFDKEESSIRHVEFHLAFMDLIVTVYRLFEQEMEHQPAFNTVKEQHAQSIIDYIEEHFSQELHLSDLESALHLNRYYLSKTFKEVTGTTIFNYMLERRINEAKLLLLLHPHLQITEVSDQVGFKHLSHFSRLFKKIVGTTPEQYRKQAREQVRYTNES